MAAMPTFAGTIGLAAPVYLRKLRRVTDWGDATADAENRAEKLVQVVWKCRPHPDSPFSVYLVQTDDELRRVILGLNGGRLKLTDDSAFVAIQRVDLEAVGIEAIPTDGATRCTIANRLHHDIPADDDQLLALCQQLIDRGRKAIRVTRKMTEPLVPLAHAEGCLVIPGSLGCRVNACA